MEFDIAAITKAAKADLKVEMPGSVLLYLANSVKEKHLSLMATKEFSGMMDIDSEKLDAEIEANENVGCFLLGLIKESFGGKFLDMFIGADEEDELPEPNAKGSDSVN